MLSAHTCIEGAPGTRFTAGAPCARCEEVAQLHRALTDRRGSAAAYPEDLRAVAESLPANVATWALATADSMRGPVFVNAIVSAAMND